MPCHKIFVKCLAASCVGSVIIVKIDVNLQDIIPKLFADETRGCINTICPPEDEQGTARNMLRIVMQHMYCYRIKEVCIKLVT